MIRAWIGYRNPVARRTRRILSKSVFVTSGVAGLILAIGTASAQESPAEVTASQVALYQLGLEAACKHSGRKRGEPPELVDSACGCMTRVLKEDASFSEWQHAYYYRVKRLKREESGLLAAHMPRLQACKAEAR